MSVPSPTKPGMEVKWDCLLVTGSVPTRNSRQEMEAVVRGMGLRGEPTLYRVNPRVGRVANRKFFLTLQAKDHGFSGRIERSTDQLVPIPLPVMVQGLNPRWDACVWYRGRTQLEVVHQFRDPWGVKNPYRMGGAYEPRVDDIQFLPVIEDDKGYCQLDTDKQAADVFIGNPLVCDEPAVFLTLVKAEKGRCVFEINNPTDRAVRCTVRPSKGFELVGAFWETVALEPGQFRSVTVTTPATRGH
jgi:hypothetical protein